MSCLLALLMFMQDRAGMPNYDQGWVLHNGDLLAYTWYTNKNSVEYFAIARKKEDIAKVTGEGARIIDALKPTGRCGNNYIIFEAKGKLTK